MITKKFSLLFILYCFGTTALFAQTNDSILIKGQITDSLQQPVAWATVTLTKGDTIIFTIPANATGVFSFAAKEKAGTLLTITSTACLPFSTTIPWARAESGTLNMGRIMLQQKGTALQNVTVTATKPLIKKKLTNWFTTRRWIRKASSAAYWIL